MSSFELIHVEAPSQPLLAPNEYKNVKFARITEQDASGKKKAPLNGQQLMVLKEMYRPCATATQDRIPADHLFKLDDRDQLHAAAIMVQHGLDLKAREDLSNRKILYLCACGYDHTCNESKKRQTPVPFTGCLGHAEITFVISSQKIPSFSASARTTPTQTLKRNRNHLLPPSPEKPPKRHQSYSCN
ncbi:hypothetical protein B0H14DRAFT_3485150 [Mycena olivaceomarginata]|nr:hypothetical protein B0H14DRAFT_3485150 [Mycena olivaceomarginata]